MPGIKGRTNRLRREEVTMGGNFWCGPVQTLRRRVSQSCEQLNEIGFKSTEVHPVPGVPSRVVWSLAPLKEDTSARTSFWPEPGGARLRGLQCIDRMRGGIRRGISGDLRQRSDGLGAVAVLKRAGAARVILSETVKERAEMGEMGADFIINPMKEDSRKECWRSRRAWEANL